MISSKWRRIPNHIALCVATAPGNGWECFEKKRPDVKHPAFAIGFRIG
jgi:hypothetical protein